MPLEPVAVLLYSRPQGIYSQLQAEGIMPRSKRREHKVIFKPMGRRASVGDGKTIKEASRELGVGIEGICGDRGTCGKCRVRVESRGDALSPVNEAEMKLLSARQRRDGYRLACQARIHGDVAVFVPEESRTVKQIIRKAATERAIDLKPAVTRYYVEMTPATLDDATGDWERLTAELESGFGLNNLTIDYRVLAGLQGVVRKGDWKVTVWVWKGSEVIRVKPGLVDKGYGLAVDIGTTTVAGYLCDLASGEVIATESEANPQAEYGEDVMSRISYTMNHKGGCERLHKLIIKTINHIAGRATAHAGVKRRAIVDMAVVGNTCMHHLFLNIDPRYLGRVPFTPSVHRSLDFKARDLGLRIAPGAYVHVLPIEAGFVGADNVGVLIAEEPYNQDDVVLIIDVGTNGELILGNRGRLLSSSCATGPAFEGASIRHGMRAAPGAIERIEIDSDTMEVRFKVIGRDGWSTELEDAGARGICGSGIIDAAAQLLRAGIVDRSGRFNKDVETRRLRVSGEGPEFVIAWASETAIGGDIVVCQQDVRSIQLAKGAMYAGAKIMMQHLGVKRLDKVILAGAFGSYIDKEAAAVIGLFPDCALDNVYAVGNAAGDGARIALLNVDKRAEADEVARRVEYRELTVEPGFNKVFTQAMWFPHMEDTFPHLKHLLP